MEGKGIYYYNIEDKYEGDWKNDKREEKGILYYNNEGREMGNYFKSKRIGKNVTLTINREVYIKNSKILKIKKKLQNIFI